MKSRLIEWGITVILIVMPWHEFICQIWKPLGAWKDILAVTLLILALPPPRSRWAAAAAAALVSATLSCLVTHTSLLGVLRPLFLPMALTLAASRLERIQVYRVAWRFSAAGAPACLYALVSYIAFRAIGGGHYLRPVITNPLLKALVYPYYTGQYERGWRLIGSFENDIYFGIWAAAILAVAWVAFPRRPLWRGIMVTLCVACIMGSFSRSAMAALVGVVLMLGWRVDRRILGVLVIGALLVPFVMTPQDIMRFRDSGGRTAAIGRGVSVLASGSLTGHGSAGLFDMQYAKLAYSFGWLGTLTFAWLFVESLRPSRRRLGYGLTAATLAILLGGFGSEVLEVPQTAYTLWALVGMALALAKVRYPDPESRATSPTAPAS